MLATKRAATLSPLASGLLLAGTAHAQAAMRFGPQVGFVRATVYNTSATNYSTARACAA